MDNLPTTPTSLTNTQSVSVQLVETAIQFPTFWDDLDMTWNELGLTWDELTDLTPLTNQTV